MKRCRGVVSTQKASEPISRCGATSDRSYCERCASDPAQAFWSEVLRPNWDRDLEPTVNQILTAAPAPKRTVKAPLPRKKRAPQKKPLQRGLMSREEARKLLLGG
jgi:hypothetical protein